MWKLRTRVRLSHAAIKLSARSLVPFWCSKKRACSFQRFEAVFSVLCCRTPFMYRSEHYHFEISAQVK